MGNTGTKDMHDVAKRPRYDKQSGNSPERPQARTESHLAVPLISPLPVYRLSPALDEFSLRRTPSRGGTASPTPAKGVRKRLHRYSNFDHAVDLISRSTNIIILTGAGISTSLGIPDFRSDKGLYSQLSKDLGITEAEEFFSRDYFVQNTELFFQYVKRVIPEAVIGPDGFFRHTNTATGKKDSRAVVPRFSLTHAFLALLHSKGKLLTNYTQNIDGLELAAGVPYEKFIQCHGSWDTASCMTCGRSSAARKYLPVVFAGNIPYCKCKLESEQNRQRMQKKRSSKKRSWDDFDSDHSSDDGTKAPRGLLKPDITFFNERLSGSYGERLNEDKRKVDLLIIIGTSLKVGPVQDMLYQLSPKVPQIFISRERFSGALCNLPGVQVDIELLGECDIIVEELCRRAGWSLELESSCWEKGQMRIKETDAVLSGPQALSTVEKQRTNSCCSDQSSIDARPQKKLVPDIVSRAKEDGNPGDGNRNSGQTLHSVTQLAPTTINSGSSQLPVKKMGDPKNVSTTPGDLKENVELTRASQSKQTKDSRGDSTIKSTNSLVKVELVEGTAHQWRVTRK